MEFGVARVVLMVCVVLFLMRVMGVIIVIIVGVIIVSVIAVRVFLMFFMILMLFMVPVFAVLTLGFQFCLRLSDSATGGVRQHKQIEGRAEGRNRGVNRRHVVISPKESSLMMSVGSTRRALPIASTVMTTD